MRCVIARNEDGKYVAKPGSEHSYTRSLANAQKFDSEEEASRAKCGNETIVPLQPLLDQIGS